MSSTSKQSAASWHTQLAGWVHRRSTLWILLSVLAFGILIGHQTLGVIDRDEARFAQASKQMLASGDYITPRFMDELRAKKPIGIYWLQSVCATLFGQADIASYRLPSLVGFLLSLVLIFRFSQSLWPSSSGPAQGLIAVLLLASSPLLIAEAHLAKTDSVLLMVLLVQQLMLWRIYKNRFNEEERPPCLAFWVCMSLGILVKGPISPLLAMTSCLVLCGLDRHVGWLKKLQLFKGLLVVCCLVLPWAIAVSSATDGAFLDIAIKGDFLSKVQSAQESHGAPPGTYLALLGVLFWPGLAFAGHIAGLGRQLITGDAARFCLAWFVGYWLVIEFVPTKLPHYILPALPALALLISHALCSRMPQRTRLTRRISEGFMFLASICGLVLVAALLWASVRFGGVTGGRAFLFALVTACLIAMSLWRLWLWRQHHRLGDILVVLGCGALAHIIAIAGVVAGASAIHISSRLAAEIKRLPNQPAIISLIGYHEPSAVFHLGRDILLLNADEAAVFMADSKDGLAVVEQSERQAFLGLADKLGLSLVSSARVSGFNISRGRDVELILYQRSSL
tara:strand:+ start:322 stop:2019 length:1698 start_codon:yes stop_codon:yes gene_type:complete